MLLHGYSNFSIVITSKRILAKENFACAETEIIKSYPSNKRSSYSSIKFANAALLLLLIILDSAVIISSVSKAVQYTADDDD